MKLRFRSNSLRLRLNRREVEALASGTSLREEVVFPNNAHFAYIFEPQAKTSPEASFKDGVIRIAAPLATLRDWAHSEAIGLYFEVASQSASLRVAIEKDLECVDGPAQERDPEAFPRSKEKVC